MTGKFWAFFARFPVFYYIIINRLMREIILKEKIS